MFTKFARKSLKRGQTMTEYIIIVALIAIASIAIVTVFSNQIRSLFYGSSQQLAGDTTAQAEDKTQGAGDFVNGSTNDWKDASGN